eukprot:SAG31_NODE_1430_length_8385_cov_3.096186_5_plen_56_part_00
MHPGGAASILMCAGEDGTEDFEAIAVSMLTANLKSFPDYCLLKQRIHLRSILRIH